MIALDTNILIYAITDDEADGRHQHACDILVAIASSYPVLPLPVIGEFLNVCRKRKRPSFTSALDRADHLIRNYNCVTASPSDYIRAGTMSHRYGIQYFDALILSVARRAGATAALRAGLNWNRYIKGTGNLDVGVDFTLTGDSVATGGSTYVFPLNGLVNTVQSVASDKLRTGLDQNGAAADVNFNLNPIYLTGPEALWYDPDPVTRTTPIPTFKTDAVSVFIHEFGHALAFSGFKNDTTGVLTGSVRIGRSGG